MIVARQFIAWYPCKKGNRPVGHVTIGSGRRATIRTINQPRGKDQTVPTGRVAFLGTFQAINCLATIIQSLRDRVRHVPNGTTNRPEHMSAKATPPWAFLEDSLPRRRLGEGGRTRTKVGWEAGPASIGWSCFLPKIPLALY
jgi:hypothetical protein